MSKVYLPYNPVIMKPHNIHELEDANMGFSSLDSPTTKALHLENELLHRELLCNDVANYFYQRGEKSFSLPRLMYIHVWVGQKVPVKIRSLFHTFTDCFFFFVSYLSQSNAS